MDIKVPVGAEKIFEAFDKKGYEIYVVGGAVRDLIMGKGIYDWDFTTNATPEEMLGFLKDSYYTNSFGMVGVPDEIEGERPYEITTFRTEYGYTDSRRPDKVEWGKTLEEDLKRRDFTINAMALKPSGKNSDGTYKFTLIDLYEGQEDIKRKMIRAVGDPHERFSEDALRMMRAVRIGAEIGFTIEETTHEAIKNNAQLINKISAERVRDELLKTLASPNPDHGIMLLKETGILHEIFPELEENFGVPQASPGRHHIYDVGTHSVMALKYVSEKNPDPIVRLATLIHDVGKAKTFKKLESGTITFYNHEVVSGQVAKRFAERIRLSNKDKERLWKLVRFHQFTVDEKQTDSAVRRFIRNIGKENIKDMLDLRVGDRLGGGARETSWRLEEFKTRVVEVQKQPFSVTDLKIGGREIMKALNIDSGPKVGQVLSLLFTEVVEGKVKNNKEELTKRLETLKE